MESRCEHPRSPPCALRIMTSQVASFALARPRALPKIGLRPTLYRSTQVCCDFKHSMLRVGKTRPSSVHSERLSMTSPWKRRRLSSLHCRPWCLPQPLRSALTTRHPSPRHLRPRSGRRGASLALPVSSFQAADGGRFGTGGEPHQTHCRQGPCCFITCQGTC